MDYDEYIFNIEQKKAYDSFTKEALIDIVMRKNRQLAEWASQKVDASTEPSINNDVLLGTVPKKPPLGIMPKHIHDELRQGQLLAAIKRYAEARKTIPQEWITEFAGIVPNSRE